MYRIIQETLICIVCLFVELTSNNFPFFTKDLNFTTPCVPKSSTRPPLSPLREHLRRFSVITTVEPLHNGHLGDRRKWPLWRGGRYGEVGV